MAVPPPEYGDKRALRALMRARRDSFVQDGHPQIRVPSRFWALLQPDMVVAGYHPIGSEADPAPLLRAAREAGCRIALPHVADAGGTIRFLDAGDGVLHPGPFGLRQPHAANAVLVPDIILTPLLAFDASLNRVGQGAGHYDRAFAAHPDAYRIGIGWSVQAVTALAPDPWDMPLDALVTEQGWQSPAPGAA